MSTPEADRESGSAERTLVIIDMQEIFRRPDSEWFAPRYEQVAAEICELVPLFGGRVVLTRFVAPDAPGGAWVDYYRRFPFALVDENDQLYELSSQFADLDHPVVTMPTFGKWGSELAAAIGDSRDIVLTGVATECCVLATALAAADAGIHVTVVADGCAGASDEDHQRALDIMSLLSPMVDVTTMTLLGTEYAEHAVRETNQTPTR